MSDGQMWMKPGESQTDHDTRQAYHIGDDPMGEIDKAHEREGGKKSKIYQREGRNAVTQQEDNGEKTHEELHQGITQGDGGMTLPAFSPKQDKAHQGDVVIEVDGVLANWAVRRRQNNGLPLRHPMDADIEETPDNSPKGKAEEKRYQAQAHLIPLTFSLSSLR